MSESQRVRDEIINVVHICIVVAKQPLNVLHNISSS
jgi:hypothetical protein